MVDLPKDGTMAFEAIVERQKRICFLVGMARAATMQAQAYLEMLSKIHVETCEMSGMHFTVEEVRAAGEAFGFTPKQTKKVIGGD